MSTKEGSIHLIDALSGDEKKKLYAKADGTATVKFTHHEACVLVSSDICAPTTTGTCSASMRTVSG